MAKHMMIAFSDWGFGVLPLYVDEFSGMRIAQIPSSPSGPSAPEHSGPEGLLLSFQENRVDAPRRLIFRGDLQSATGYGKETRAWAHILSRRFEIFGVDLHFNPNDSGNTFPGPLIHDSELLGLIAASEMPPIVVNNTVPDMFAVYPGAINIGTFPWETDAIPFLLNWPDMISAMDYVWAQTTFMARFIRRCGYERPLSMITWPHQFEGLQLPDTGSLQDVLFIHYQTLSGRGPSRSSAKEVRNSAATLFLSVQSLAPRKGLPVLLSEWRDYVLQSDNDDTLLLKLRFIHNTRVGSDPSAHFTALLREVGYMEDDPVRIALVSEDVADSQVDALYALSDAYVTASYGEGFGGPVAESLAFGRPVVAPRHTGALDLIPPDYPLIVEHEERVVGLRGNLGVYPHSASWCVPRRGAFAGAFAKFSAMATSQRLEALLSARAYASAFCSIETVEKSLHEFFDDILGEDSGAPPVGALWQSGGV